MAVASATFPALGTTALLAVTDPAALAAGARMLREGLREVDRACSRFRDDSELTALNRAAGRPVAVGPVLREAVAAALHAAEATEGDVDPTVGAAVVALGYDRDFALLARGGAGPVARPLPAAGWRTVRIDRAAGTVRLAPGTRLDLGATAKALAADRLSAAIHAATGAGTLVALGGDIAVAGRPPDDGWPVRVGDDHRAGDDAAGQTVALSSGGLATSSTTVRRWAAGGRARHHIVDPRRGEPAEAAWRTVSVAAATCLDANAASTAAIVRGRGGAGWLERSGLPARLVAPDGSVARVAGWPAPENAT
jgi:thiamine biosynthesis lipoprotein